MREIRWLLVVLLGVVLSLGGCGGDNKVSPEGKEKVSAPKAAGAATAVPAAEKVAAQRAAPAEKAAAKDEKKADEVAEETEPAADEKSAEPAEEEKEAEEPVVSAVETDEEEAESLAPFVPTPLEIVEAMLKIADVKAGDTVYDLGCGDGRIIIMAVEKFGAKAVGIELDKDRYETTLKKVKELGLSDKVTVKNGDLLKEDLSPATVVTIYLMPDANAKLRENFKKYLKPGTRIVSHDFSIRDWEAVDEKKVTLSDAGDEHTVYLYKM